MIKIKKNPVTLITILFILLLSTLPNLYAKKTTMARGIVFEDINNNGILDKGEPGIPGVPVSNQVEVILTDANGRFSLPVSEPTIIFVTKPPDYSFPLNSTNYPLFYYIHCPKGSPTGLKYKGIDPTGKLPPLLYFPLKKTDALETFDAIITGDPQTATLEEIDFFRDDIISKMMNHPAQFYLALGDNMYDDLSLYEELNHVTAQLGIPIYLVMGNHDMNYQVPGYQLQAETFKKWFGPDYYSFNYGRVHFIVLNSIKYQGWNTKENKKGKYTGYIHDQQMTWLKNDLAFVPEDFLVVLTMHIPIHSEIYNDDYSIITNRTELFKLLEKRNHLLALAGHMHYFEYLELDQKTGWNSSISFPLIIANAGCGTWWHGPLNPRGIPLGLCTDGAPNGFFIFTFTGNQYTYRFYPSSSSSDTPFRVNTPARTVSISELPGLSININVFAGTPRTQVSYQLDNGPETPMTRTVMEDPFFKDLVKRFPDQYKDWMKPTLSTHIWTSPLPGTLAPGIHRLFIAVKDHQGMVFTGNHLFRVKE